MTNEEYDEIEERIRQILAQATLSDDPDEEAHQIRDAMAAACSHDMNTMYEHLRERQRRDALAGRRIYTLIGDEFVDVTDKIISEDI